MNNSENKSIAYLVFNEMKNLKFLPLPIDNNNNDNSEIINANTDEVFISFAQINNDKFLVLKLSSNFLNLEIYHF